MKKIKLIKWVVFIIVIVIFSVYAVTRTFFCSGITFDDSIITNIYAKNFTNFGKFFYNNIHESVDGFTSFLDVIIRSVIYKFFLHDIIKAHILALLIYLLLLLFSLSYFIIKLRINNNDDNENNKKIFTPFVFSVGILSIYFNEIIYEAASSYLETSLYLLIGFWAVYLLPVNKEKKLNHILFFINLVLLILVRPEGSIFAIALIIAYIIILKLYYMNNFTKNKFYIILIISFIVLFILYYVWRIYTFGYWAPNTYYAKTSALRINEILDGINYMLHYFKLKITNIFRFLFILSLPLFSVLLKWKNKEHQIRFIILCIIIFILLLGTIYTGADCYIDSSRIISLPLVLSLVAAFYIIANSKTIIKIIIITFILFIIAGDIIYSPKTSILIPLKNINYVHNIFNPTTNWILKVTDYESKSLKKLDKKYPDIKVAQSDFQRIKLYFNNIEVIDLHGLNDKTIAHKKINYPVQWGKASYHSAVDINAEIWIMGFRFEQPTSWVDTSVIKVLTSSDLFNYYIGGYTYNKVSDELIPIIANNYFLASLPLKIDKQGAIELYLNFFIRKDFADKIKDDNLIYISKM